MLIRFRVTNYRSINETQEFSTLKGRVKIKPEHLGTEGNLSLLKFSAIYGANASGKSNFIEAISLSKQIIYANIPPGIGNDYHRLQPQNKTKPTTFEYEIAIGSKCYAYGFDIILSEAKITGEWLYEIALGRDDKLIFEREPAKDTNNQRFKLGKKYDKKTLKTYAEGMNTNTSSLFLHEMNSNKSDIYDKYTELSPIKSIYLWIMQNLSVTPAGLPLPSQPFYVKEDFDIELANKIIPSLGLGISKIELSDESIDGVYGQLSPDKVQDLLKSAIFTIKQREHAIGKKTESANLVLQLQRQYFILIIDVNTFEIQVKRLWFVHDGSPTLFDLAEESDGTQRMIDLIEILFAAANGSNSTYIIDEIDRSLHPALTRRLIELYLQLADNTNMQLIVTTHDSHLMDLNFLRRDEIWLINKNSNGESEIYSLDQFNVRFDKKISRAYMEGRYGAIPTFTTVQLATKPENRG